MRAGISFLMIVAAMTKSTEVLPLKQEAEWNGFAFAVQSYEVTSECRSRYDGTPAEGAKVVYVWIALRNVSEKV